MSINKIILLGNVGKDPDVRYLDNGVSVARFSLATTERGYTLANGTVVPERAEWHNVVAWRGLAELAEKYIHKGSQLYV
ncbi:MAG: single-stranded DNA-binding protein, partial [Bacteroidales bacterium]|nr:single-stranded DNA-binding protein [Bacteroidales bacterium]